MQRITNCILQSNDHILLLKKPRRGWYAFPGGKMEQGETIKEAAVREFKEETALDVQNPNLAGVFTFSIFDKGELIEEWMMFTFFSDSSKGKLTDYCLEGELEWIPINKLDYIPIAEGDRQLVKHILASDEMLYGSFSYTEDFQLIESRFDPSNP